jgi:hypothetical protein
MRFLSSLKEGKWVRPKRSGWIHECCYCGLRHKVSFKLIKYNKKDHEILFKWEREHGN